MKFEDMKIVYYGDKLADNYSLVRFLRANHYSKTIQGLSCVHLFGLIYENKLIGVAVISNPFGVKCRELYSRGKNSEGVYELRRFCLDDIAPKNTGSFFISKIIKYLKKFTDCHTLISYSDPYYGHQGTLYKASNFKYMGTQKHKSAAYKIGDKLYHQRNISQKSSKGLSDTAIIIREKRAIKVILPKKHIFLYELVK